MLRRDATIELKTVLQNGDLEYAEQDVTALKGFPLRREDLFQFDVVVLGDVNPAGLTAAMMQNLADFVDRPGKGGSLVLIAGPKYMPLTFRDTPLAHLIPIDLVPRGTGPPASPSWKASPCSRPISGWPRRACTWETRWPTRQPSGRIFLRSIGCWKP